MESFQPMNSILDTDAPLKKVNKYKLKFKTKPFPFNSLFLLKIIIIILKYKKSFRRDIAKITEICYLQFQSKTNTENTVWENHRMSN